MLRLFFMAGALSFGGGIGGCGTHAIARLSIMNAATLGIARRDHKRQGKSGRRRSNGGHWANIKASARPRHKESKIAGAAAALNFPRQPA